MALYSERNGLPTNKVKTEIKNNTDSKDLKVIFKELEVVKEALEKVKNISL